MAADEERWVAAVESKRAELDASTDTMTMRRSDYTGDPRDHDRTETETVGAISRQGSKSRAAALLLHKLIRELQPERCLELGTCVGISAAYQAAALESNQRGNLVTCDASRDRMAVAERTVADLGLIDRVSYRLGRFQETLGPVTDEIGPIDYAFVDGHHDGAATLDYFERIVPALASHGVVVFDDIRWSEGMFRAWSRISADQRVGLSVDLGAMGLAVVDADGRKESISAPMV